MSFETGFIAFLSDALHLPHAAKGTDERFGTAKRTFHIFFHQLLFLLVHYLDQPPTYPNISAEL